MLQVKAINSTVTRLYAAGDQYHQENRVPEVGSNATFEDGREYVFCSTEENITVGQSVGAYPAQPELTAITALVASGSTEISFVKSGVGVNQYQGGYLTVTLGTGLGYTYKIKSNTVSATVDAVANTVVVTLESEVNVDIAATDNIIIKTARAALVAVGATLDPVGTAVVTTTAGTTGVTEYFWAQTSGVAIALGTAGAANVSLTPAVAGALAAADGTDIVVATGLAAGASNSMVNLCYPKA